MLKFEIGKTYKSNDDNENHIIGAEMLGIPGETPTEQLIVIREGRERTIEFFDALPLIIFVLVLLATVAGYCQGVQRNHVNPRLLRNPDGTVRGWTEGTAARIQRNMNNAYVPRTAATELAKAKNNAHRLKIDVEDYQKLYREANILELPPGKLAITSQEWKEIGRTRYYALMEYRINTTCRMYGMPPYERGTAKAKQVVVRRRPRDERVGSERTPAYDVVHEQYVPLAVEWELGGVDYRVSKGKPIKVR